MWVLKTKIFSENTIIGNITKKFNITISGYPIKYFKKKENLLLQVSGFVEGGEKNIKKFQKYLKGNNLFEKTYFNKNFIIASIQIPLYLESLYSSDIIFLSSMRYDLEGNEYLEIASWEKEKLSEILNILKEHYKVDILFFSKRKIDDISIISYNPQLTDKQKIALQLAIKNGYYKFPKKITLAKLAEIMRVSPSTYQAHLSKAEAKFIPKMYKKVF